MDNLSLDKSLLRIFRDLNDNVAPTDSPNFTGIPRVPSPDGENVKQIVNTEYSTRAINELYDLIYDNVSKFETKINKYNDKVSYLDELQEFSSNGQLPSLSTWAKAITFEGWKESENVNTRVFMINDVDLLNDIERGIVKGFNLNLMPLSECDYAVFNNMEVIIEYKNN